MYVHTYRVVMCELWSANRLALGSLIRQIRGTWGAGRDALCKLHTTLYIRTYSGMDSAWR